MGKNLRGKRFVHWYIWEKYHNTYPKFEDFKGSWDPNTKVSSEIYNGIKTDLYNGKRKLSVFKKTFKWFTNPGSRRR